MVATIGIRRGRVYRLATARLAVNSVSVPAAGAGPVARLVVDPAAGAEYEAVLPVGGHLVVGEDVWEVERIVGAGTRDQLVWLARGERRMADSG